MRLRRKRKYVLHWLILAGSAIFEAVWATALSVSDGLRRLVPAIVFFVASVISLVGLGYAMREIPTGTAYAAWTAIGASATAAWAIIRGREQATIGRLACLAGIIGCVVGLRVIS